MRILKTTGVVIAAALVAALIYLSTLPIDLSGYKSGIEEYLGAATGSKVAVDAVTLRLLPSPEVHATGVSLTRKGRSAANAASIRVRVSLLPLISRRLEIRSIEVRSAELRVERDAHGEIALAGIAPLGGRAQGAAPTVDSVVVDNARVWITDRGVKGGAVHMITGLKARMKSTAAGVEYRIEGRLAKRAAFSSSGVFDPASSSLKAKASIRDLPLASVSPYLDEMLPGTSLSRMTASASARIEMSRAGHGLRLNLDDLSLGLPGISLKGSVEETEAGLTLSLSAAPAKLDALTALVPVAMLPARAARVMEAMEPGPGTVEIESMVLSGRPGEGLGIRPLEGLSASVRLNGAGFSYTGLAFPVRGLTGRVSVSGGAVRIEGLSARYGKGRISALDATLKPTGALPSYDIAIKASIDAEETLDLLRAFKGPLPQRPFAALEELRASGRIALDLKAGGRLSERPAMPVYSASVRMAGLDFSHSRLPLSFYSIRGDVSLNNKEIEFKGLSGGVSGTTFRLSGTLKDYLKAAPYFDLHADGAVALKTITPFIKGTRFEPLSIGRRVSFTAGLKGKRAAFDARISLDATSTGLVFGDMVRKAQNFPLVFKGSVSKDNDEITIDSASLRIGSSSVEIKAGVRRDLSSYALGVRTSGLKIDDLARVTPAADPGGPAAGVVEADLTIEREAGWRVPSLDGEVSIRALELGTPYFAHPLNVEALVAEFGDNKGRVRLDAFSTGRTRIDASAEILDLRGRVMDASVVAGALYTQDLKPVRRLPRIRLNGPPLTGTFTLRAGTGELLGHPVNGLSIDAVLTGKALYLNPVFLNIDGGDVTVAATVFRRESERLLYKLDMAMTGVDTKTMLRNMGAKKGILEGRLRGRISLMGKRGASSPARGLSGEAHLEADDGRLWKFVLFSKIFSIVNILSIEDLFELGLRYKSISGDFTIKDGIVHSENLYLESPSLRMSALGDIDLEEKTIDGVLAMHPFVTIDKIISTIPVAGWIITGRTRSTISMYYKVSGPLKKHKVEPIHIKGLARDVFGILQRLVEEPVGPKKRDGRGP